ncbi:hypothetical protein RFI_03718, partial [Reticulomyxa filosa]
MSSYKVFVYFEGKAHELTLASLNLKSLEEEVVKIVNIKDDNKKTINSMRHFKIVDNNKQEIINDQQLKISFEMQPVFFFVYPIGKEENERYKIMNPLVLLTGALKYNSLDYLPEVKLDLIMFRNLFEEIYGYEVYSTYDPNKPETELLTLNQLNHFSMKHCTNNNEKKYDSLIFVWCGHGDKISEEEEEGDILITSDNDKYISFKKIQQLFTYDTNTFLNRPKIFIKNVYRRNEQYQQQQQQQQRQQQWYNNESDTFIIFSTTPEKLIFEKGSYFTECFCNIMSQNIKLPKSLDSNLMSISKLIEQKALTGQIFQVITMCDRHVFLYNKDHSYHQSNINIEIDQDLLWNEANKKAHEMVNEMINNKQQGIIVVAKSNEQLSPRNMPFSMMITSLKHMKKISTFGQYSIYSFFSKKIIFDNITIDGCIYAIDCIIDAIGNCDITQQLIHTNNSVIRCNFNYPVFTYSWPIDTEELMELGIDSFNIQNLDKAIELFRFSLCISLQTLHSSHIDISKSCDWLGRTYNKKGKYDKAVEYYKRSLK